MRAAQLPQNQVSMLAGIIDVVQDGRAANLARVVDNHIAETQDALRN